MFTKLLLYEKRDQMTDLSGCMKGSTCDMIRRNSSINYVRCAFFSTEEVRQTGSVDCLHQPFCLFVLGCFGWLVCSFV